MRASSTLIKAQSRRNVKSNIGILGGVLLLAVFTVMMTSITYIGNAENFTDIFYTNSFRGAFNWIKKLDWVGMLVQMVISCFSLFGVALMTIRIMTSMLFLSSKGLWEEVHDQKQTGESDLFDFGLINMAKSWAKGKAGTGLDAVVGAVLLLLPDVKKYSDFGDKANGEFDENMSISQYMLKIALPTVMTVFFFAMGFNGTLFQALAVTVDAMGTAADKAISVNYAGFVEDLVNRGTGYKFAFSADGSNIGKFQQNIAKDLYGRLVSEMRGADAEQLEVLGKNVEEFVRSNIVYDRLADAPQVSEAVREGLAGSSGDANPDNFIGYLGYEIVVNSSPDASGEYQGQTIEEFFEGVPRRQSVGSASGRTIHLFVKQSTAFSGTYFNLDGAVGN